MLTGGPHFRTKSCICQILPAGNHFWAIKLPPILTFRLLLGGGPPSRQLFRPGFGGGAFRVGVRSFLRSARNSLSGILGGKDPPKTPLFFFFRVILRAFGPQNERVISGDSLARPLRGLRITLN